MSAWGYHTNPIPHCELIWLVKSTFSVADLLCDASGLDDVRAAASETACFGHWMAKLPMTLDLRPAASDAVSTRGSRGSTIEICSRLPALYQSLFL